MFSVLSSLGGVWGELEVCLGVVTGEGLKGLGGCGELRFWGDVGVNGSRTDWLVSSGTAGGSGGNGINESAIVHWFVKES